MKKLIGLMVLALFVLSVHARGDLERAIHESDTTTVRSIFGSTSISKSEQQRLLILADDVLRQRRSKYEIHFSKDKQPMLWFEFSKEKILTALGGIGLVVAGFFAASREDSDLHGNFGDQFASVISSGVPGCILGVSGGLIFIGTILKHYWDVKKSYDRAIEVKQELLKAAITD